MKRRTPLSPREMSNTVIRRRGRKLGGRPSSVFENIDDEEMIATTNKRKRGGRSSEEEEEEENETIQTTTTFTRRRKMNVDCD